MQEAPEIIATKFINRTSRHLFLTGKAGTGKTTFLRQITEHTYKNTVIAAPTGIAAINAGGVTLHSLFQLPFGSFIPSDAPLNMSVTTQVTTPKQLTRNLQMHSSKRRLLQEIELLIIDEVSMLRADLLDAIDNILRYVRRKRSLPFGGVQLLFIGDLHQLPPVVKDGEWSMLGAYYKSIHFFEALALGGQKPVYIELEKIYRQTDDQFISLLNNFRENKVSNEDITMLNKCLDPDFKPDNGDGYIHLTTHNRIADEINREALKRLSGVSHQYSCEIEGNFNEHQYPIDPVLELKEGAQVMFIKNDYTGQQRYFNGKIGVVTELGEEQIEVGFMDGSDPAWVERYEWQNKKYSLNKISNEIEEDLLGAFSHYPIKLAWAVTIHKSQGLTFEKAIIDVEKAFAPGQIYVALSRLVSLDGLVLASPVPVSALKQDSEILRFASDREDEVHLNEILEHETHQFLTDTIMRAFELFPLENALSYHLQTYTKKESHSKKQLYKKRLEKIGDEVRPEVEVSKKFLMQINSIARNHTPENLDLLKERVGAAIDYFEPKIKLISKQFFSIMNELSDVKGVKKYITELKDLESLFFGQLKLMHKAEALIYAVIKNQDLTKEDIKTSLNYEERVIKEPAKKTRAKKSKTKKKPGEKKVPTKTITFNLFKEGKNITEIANERSLVPSTIESHLSHFVKSGEIDILEILDEDKVDQIQKALKENRGDTIIPVKKQLGDDVTFGEIRMVLASKQA
jgi:hypothetical protein